MSIFDYRFGQGNSEDMPMEKWKLKQTASLLVVMLFALSAFAVLAPTGGSSQANRTTTVQSHPAATGGNTFQVALVSTLTGTSILPPPSNANVTLVNTHNPSVRYVLNSSTQFAISGVPKGTLVPGYYTVSASAPGYFTSTLPQSVAFNNTVSVVTPNLELYEINMTATNKVAVTVTGAGANIKGAFVQAVVTTFSNGAVIDSSLGVYNQTVASGYTNGTGVASMQLSTSYNYQIVASLNNSNSTLSSYFGPAAAADNAAATTAVTIALPHAYHISGVVKTSGNTLASGTTAYMLSYASTSLPLQLRFFEATISTGYFYSFYVPAGSYVMAINATGQGSYITDVTVSASTSINVQLPAKMSSLSPISRTDIAYAAGTPNWNYMNITYNQSLDNGSTIQGLPYSSVPSVAMQLALAFNDGYPAVNASTVSAAASAVTSLGPEYTTTYSLLSVNSTNYLGGNAYTASLQGVQTGTLLLTTGFYYNITDSYHTLSSVAANTTSYSLVLQADYNTTEMQSVYILVLPTGFQLSTNSSSGPFGPVNVVGHTTVTVYGTVTGYGYATVSMSIQKGSTPVVHAAVVTGTYAFAYSKSGVLQYYIVRAGMSINYTTQGSYDPSGGPLSYSWHWNNTTSASSYTNTSQLTAGHTYYNYTTPGQYMYVKLVATTVTGHQANTTIKVRVANDTTLSASLSAVGKKIYSGTIFANQSIPVTVNGLASKASVSPGDNQGTIVSYNFSWGDGAKNYTVVSYTAVNLNATHSYYSPGNYTLNLTVTDEVGYTATTSLKVQVNKTLKPVVSFLVYNSKWQSASGSVQENSTVHFNASATTDPNFPVSSLVFKWNFGTSHITTTNTSNPEYGRYQNITGAAGTNVSHIFTAISSTPVTVTLTVVDPAGNNASQTYNLTVTSQPRPNLRIINITFSPKVFTQGSAGTIKVTMMNIGNANATGSTITLVAINAQSGNKINIGTISSDSFYNTTTKASVLSIAPNETVYGTIHWSAPSFGNFTIKATASASSMIGTGSATQPISINQSQLQVYALYIGIVVIIVAVVAVIALRRRMPRRKGYEKGQPPKKSK